MQQPAQPRGPLRLEGPMDRPGPLRARPQRGRPAGVEGVQRVAHGLLAAAELPGDRGHRLAPRAGEHDLAAAEREGVRRAQPGLRLPALGVGHRTHEDGMSHTPSHTTLPTIPAGIALVTGSGFPGGGDNTFST